MNIQTLTFECPSDCTELDWVEDSLYCPQCEKKFPIVDDIPVLFSDELHSDYRESKDTPQEYYREVSAEYDRTHSVAASGAQRFAQQYKAKIAPYLKSKPSTFEIGSGTGFATNIISKLTDSLVISDASLEMLRVNHARHPELPAVCCPSENIPFSEGSFDVVLGNNTFYLVPNKEKGAEQISKVLKKGGYFIVSEMNPFQFLWPIRFVFGGRRWFELSVYQLFPSQMKRRFEAAGMRIEECDCYAFAPYFSSERALKFYDLIERTLGRSKILRRFLAIRIYYVIKKL